MVSEHDLDAIAAEARFSGVVRVDRGNEVVVTKAYGLADRGHEIPNEVDTQFAIASGLKGLTALAVVSLIEDGTLELGTTARSLLGEDLPLIADDVTVEHLLAHRSGIGDYLDEDGGREITDYVMPVPVHQLATAEEYVPILAGHETKFAAGTSFSYCNGGFVVLAVLAERASGIPYHELVAQRVCAPAGLRDTAFLTRTSCRDEQRSVISLPTVCARTCSTCRYGASATAGSTRRRRTSGRCGRRSSADGSSRPTGSPR